MAIETISYTPAGQGWSSFHSFLPDWMIGMNSTMYTWKNGNLYKHDDNAVRNNYYGTDYPSTITPIINHEPTVQKIFKTICLESNSPWQADIATDSTVGIIEASYFKEKEGDWFGYIRRDNGTIDTRAMSTQGIGEASYAALVFTFSFNIAASISEGDLLYVTDNPAITAMALVGTVVSYTSTTITVGSAAVTPSNGDFVIIVKDSTAESYGTRGIYMEAKLTNNDTTEVEIFTISSEVIKSYP